jgi:UDP-3-O-[3-hydroxymyristoyl] glucosamine N-acyltransferase
MLEVKDSIRMDQYVCVSPDVRLGKDVRLAKFINLYGCEVGDETKIGAFVEVQKGASIGRRCKFSSIRSSARVSRSRITSSLVIA